MSAASPIATVASLASFVGPSLRIATPYLAATMAGIWSEKSGVVNVALEGTLLVGALGTAAGTLASGSMVVGLACGMAAGIALQMIHGASVVFGRADAIVSGFALNLIAAASTRFLLRGLYDSSSNSPPLPASVMQRSSWSPATWAMAGVVASVAATMFALEKTRFGLRVRAAGEAPEALASVGVSVARTRLLAVVVAGALAGLGGGWLVLDQGAFTAGMSGGRGFIALAAVVVSAWRPGRAAVFCLLFGAAEAMQIALQDQHFVAHQVVQTLPYVTTLVALVLGVGRSRTPSEVARST